MSFRTLGLACAIASSGCLSSSEAGLRPSEPASPQTQLSQRDECAAACQAKYDRCSDDSAKERSEPHTSCYEDLRDCAQKCEAAVAADPATRIDHGVTVGSGASIAVGNAVISGSVPTVSKDRH